MCARRNVSPTWVSSSGSSLSRGAAVGALAWCVGFVATLAVTYVQFSSYLHVSSAQFTVLDAVWVGLSTYQGSHLSGLGGGPLGGGGGLAVVLAAIPVVVMLAGGALAAADRGGSLRTGASVAAGYFAVHLLAVALLVAVGEPPLVSVDPGSVLTVVANGLVQPVVVGALGGIAAR